MANKKKPHKGTENLIPVNKRTKDEAREISRKGGIKSGEVRQEKKTIKEALAWLVKQPLSDINKENFKKKYPNADKDLTDKDFDIKMGMASQVVAKALQGNIQAIALAQKIIDGEKEEARPITNTIYLTQDMVKGVENHIDEFTGNNDKGKVKTNTGKSSRSNKT